MKILVTGAGGFIGRAFCRRALERGHELIVLSRNRDAAFPMNIKVICGSLADTPWTAIDKEAPVAVVHLAGLAEPGVYLNSPHNLIWLRESQEWLKRSLEAGVKYVAGVGTCLEYAASNTPLLENMTPVETSFPYTHAKVALHRWLQKATNEQCGWLRIFYVYGRGEHLRRFPSAAIQHLMEKRPFTINTPGCIRDYIHVDDVAEGICMAVESRLAGPINVGSDAGVTMSSLAHHIADLMEAKPELIVHREPPTSEDRPQIVADSRLLRSTGWQPRVTLREGLLDLIASRHD